MTSIKLKVDGAKATASLSGLLTSGMVGIPVSIEYDSSWDNLSKTCVFRVGSFSRDRKRITTETTVPWEVMRRPGGKLEIGVEGRNELGDIVIPTIWATVGVILDGANATTSGASIPGDPSTPTGGSAIDDSIVSLKTTWSSRNIVDKLCPSFTESGAAVVCEPVEGYPLEVVTTLPYQDSYEAITLYHCGKNLFNVDRTYVKVNNGRATVENGVLTVYGQLVNSGRMPIKPNTKYTVSFKSTRTGTRGGGIYGVVYNASNKSTIVINNLANTTNVTYTFTTPADAVELNLSFYGSNDDTDAANYSVYREIQLEVGNTATAYEPYKCQTFTADFTKAPEMEDEGFYNWNTGLMNNGASFYLHNLTTGDFVMADEEEADTIIRNIPALPGVNTLYSDCGDTEVSGKADPVKIIEKLTNAILAQGGTV